MPRKELDWSFYMKIITSGVFIFFILSLLLGKKGFQSWEEDDGKKEKEKEHPKTNHKRPLRMRIMVLNTISLFFMLMSIQEYRLNEFMSPFGVDPDKIPRTCRTEQQGYYWVILLFCVAIVAYNYIIHFNVLMNASVGNVRTEQSSRFEELSRYIRKTKLKNGGLVIETYPYIIEFMFAVFIAFFSATTYVMFVLINYNVIEGSIFKPCFHPLNNDRFYDPYVDEVATT